MIRPVKDVLDRRGFVTRINTFDKANGINSSQKAKYEKPTWFYILACLRGCDRRPMTINDIVAKLSRYNIIVSYQMVRNFIIIMERKNESIKPHRRNCGASCYQAVTDLGDIQKRILAKPTGSRGAPSDVYWLGKSSPMVAYFKRAYDITIKP